MASWLVSSTIFSPTKCVYTKKYIQYIFICAHSTQVLLGSLNQIYTYKKINFFATVFPPPFLSCLPFHSAKAPRRRTEHTNRHFGICIEISLKQGHINAWEGVCTRTLTQGGPGATVDIDPYEF